jgi:hypothetical protein
MSMMGKTSGTPNHMSGPKLGYSKYYTARIDRIDHSPTCSDQVMYGYNMLQSESVNDAQFLTQQIVSLDTPNS